MTGRGAKTVLMLAALVVVGAGIKLAAPLLVPLLLAGFITTVTAPLVLWMRNRKVPAGIAVLLALILDVAAVALLGLLIGTSFTSFYERLPGYEERLNTAVADATLWLAAYGVSEEQILEVLDPGSLISLLASLLRSLAGLVSNLALVLVIVVFMLFEATGLRQKLSHIVQSQEALSRLHTTTREVNKYLVVKTASSVVTGILVGVWVAVWGVDLPVVWGLLAFLLNYVPTVGSILAAIPPIMLAILQLGPASALGVTLGYAVVNLSIGFLEPRILGRALGLSPLVVILSVVVWGWLLGPVGALLSVPLTMVVKIGLMNTEDLRWVAILLGPSRKMPAVSMIVQPSSKEREEPRAGPGPE